MRLIFSFVLFQLCLFAQAANETHYVGAVVEFSPTIGNASKNAERFGEFIEQASKMGADIIVFPEIGMNGYGQCLEDMLTQVPDPKDNDCPCTNNTKAYTDAFKSTSCAAKTQQIYVVVNIAEIVPCNEPSCLPRGYLKYNTNVVFDRNGVVIARYRKYNLFGELGTNITSVPEIIYFDTDFGVRFGTFICFDLLFQSPATKLVKDLGIKHIVYSTAWFSELPFLTAVQAQQGWAFRHNVTFLGSGYNDPEVGSGGSGIYVPGIGALNSTFPDEKTSVLLVSTIPKNGKVGSVRPRRDFQSKSTGMYLKRENLAAYVSAPLEILKSGTTLCHNEFCCNFSVEATAPKEEVAYRYRGLVFNGVRDFSGAATGGIQTCAITTCDNDNVTSCGARVSPQHAFKSIKISGKFKAQNATQFPSTLVSGNQLLPLDPDQLSFTSDCKGSECSISMTLLQPRNDLITFGIFGRDFTTDGQPPTPAQSKGSGKTLLSLICVLVMVLGVAGNL